MLATGTLLPPIKHFKASITDKKKKKKNNLIEFEIFKEKLVRNGITQSGSHHFLLNSIFVCLSTHLVLSSSHFHFYHLSPTHKARQVITGGKKLFVFFFFFFVVSSPPGKFSLNNVQVKNVLK